MRRVLAVLGLLSIASLAEGRDYEEGQVWTYHTRSGDESSLLQINRIDTHERLGSIFHVSILSVRLPPHGTAEPFTTDLPHCPVSRETLDKSVIALSPVPRRAISFQQGYRQWKGAFDAGKAGIFTLSIAEIVSIIEDAVWRTGQ